MNEYKKNNAERMAIAILVKEEKIKRANKLSKILKGQYDS